MTSVTPLPSCELIALHVYEISAPGARKFDSPCRICQAPALAAASDVRRTVFSRLHPCGNVPGSAHETREPTSSIGTRFRRITRELSRGSRDSSSMAIQGGPHYGRWLRKATSECKAAARTAGPWSLDPVRESQLGLWSVGWSMRGRSIAHAASVKRSSCQIHSSNHLMIAKSDLRGARACEGRDRGNRDNRSAESSHDVRANRGPRCTLPNYCHEAMKGNASCPKAKGPVLPAVEIAARYSVFHLDGDCV